LNRRSKRPVKDKIKLKKKIKMTNITAISRPARVPSTALLLAMSGFVRRVPAQGIFFWDGNGITSKLATNDNWAGKALARAPMTFAFPAKRRPQNQRARFPRHRCGLTPTRAHQLPRHHRNQIFFLTDA
jgi:hypothetical protein